MIWIINFLCNIYRVSRAAYIFCKSLKLQYLTFNRAHKLVGGPLTTKAWITKAL